VKIEQQRSRSRSHSIAVEDRDLDVDLDDRNSTNFGCICLISQSYRHNTVVLPSVSLSVILCIVAERYVLQQNYLNK